MGLSQDQLVFFLLFSSFCGGIEMVKKRLHFWTWNSNADLRCCPFFMSRYALAGIWTGKYPNV